MLCHAGMSSQATEGRAELAVSSVALPCSTHRRHTSLIWRSRCLLLIRWDRKLTLLHILGAQHLRPECAASAHPEKLGRTGACLSLPFYQAQMGVEMPASGCILAPKTGCAICDCHACVALLAGTVWLCRCPPCGVQTSANNVHVHLTYPDLYMCRCSDLWLCSQSRASAAATCWRTPPPCCTRSSLQMRGRCWRRLAGAKGPPSKAC